MSRISAQKTTLERLLARENRKLAMLDAAQVGADVTSVARQPRQPIDASKIREQFLSDFDHWPHPYLLLDPAPGLVTVDVNAAYATATLTQRNDILGRSLFDVFPDNPHHPFADGVSNLNNSLKTVAKTGRPTPCPSSDRSTQAAEELAGAPAIVSGAPICDDGLATLGISHR